MARVLAERCTAGGREVAAVERLALGRLGVPLRQRKREQMLGRQWQRSERRAAPALFAVGTARLKQPTARIITKQSPAIGGAVAIIVG